MTTEIYINEYLEQGQALLGSKWWTTKEQALREKDRNYLRTLKFALVQSDVMTESLKSSAPRLP